MISQPTPYPTTSTSKAPKPLPTLLAGRPHRYRLVICSLSPSAVFPSSMAHAAAFIPATTASTFSSFFSSHVHSSFPSSPCFRTPSPSTLHPPLRHSLVAVVERNLNLPDLPESSDHLPDPVQSSDILPDPADVPDTDFSERQRRHTSISSPPPSSIPIPPVPTVVEAEFAPGKTIRFETGRLARQAAGAVLTRVGDTIVFCTACAQSVPDPTIDFLPLRVDYAEKFSATGKTSGSYVKREGRPSEREVLISRLIDRPLRPMFADGYFNEVQVLSTVFSYDSVNPADALAISAAAAALHVSHIPLVEPVAGVRIGFIDGQFIVEPTIEQSKNSTAELVVAGTASSILMIEGHANFLDTATILDGVRKAHDAIAAICAAIEELRVKTGNCEKDETTLRTIPSSLITQIDSLASGLDEALALIGKRERDVAVKLVKDRVFSSLQPSREEEIANPADAGERLTILRLAWKEHVSERMRRRILDTGVRPDGRDVFTVRPITIDMSLLPGTHGSALFTRGETQTLAIATLGGDEMAQRFETLEGEDAARFYLQYSFPPFSVGEVGRVGAPGRREVGHGKLAERALIAAIPSQDDFPYVMRLESNILESNGSSSMASVCGGCLALLDAGVPLSCSVAGVAMGLIVDKTSGVDPNTGQSNVVVLTDILGLEDALGSCDAKFAGNREGWSALQLDVKLRGIPIELLGRVLEQAAKGRDFILDRMDEIMPKPSPHLAASIPKVMVMNIPVKRIGDLIGPGGKTVKSIIDRCGGDALTRISIDPSGRVSISSTDEEMIQKAQTLVAGVTISFEVGTLLTGTVTKVLPFGAYVKVTEGKEGWLHISELEHKHTSNVDSVCKVGDKFEVKVIEMGRNGQMKLSRKACLPRDKAPASGNAAEQKDDESRKMNGAKKGKAVKGEDDKDKKGA